MAYTVTHLFVPGVLSVISIVNVRKSVRTDGCYGDHLSSQCSAYVQGETPDNSIHIGSCFQAA